MEYWNNHALSQQKDKLHPSGTSPQHLWVAPESAEATARDCAIWVDMNLVQDLRERLGGQAGRDLAFRFVDDEFAAVADNAWTQLGCPEVTLMSAWDIFVAIANLL